jgi:hypothetical protein
VTNPSVEDALRRIAAWEAAHPADLDPDQDVPLFDDQEDPGLDPDQPVT